MVFDLDHFKKINDRFGHAIGDEALRLFASVAGINMRASDILGRFGGEEFVAILPGSANDAAVAAERVRAAFEAAGLTVADQPVGATVSIGVASGEPGADIMVMIAAADRALYKAKENGRNRVELADEHPGGAADGTAAAAVASSGAGRHWRLTSMRSQIAASLVIGGASAAIESTHCGQCAELQSKAALDHSNSSAAVAISSC